MKITDKVSLAFKDIVNRKFRSFLTIIAISVGSLLLVAMMGLGDGIMNQSKKMIDSFGATNEISVFAMDANSMMGMSEQNTNIDESQGSMVEENNSKTEIEKSSEDTKKAIKDEDLEKICQIDGVDHVQATVSSSITATKIDNGNFVDKTITVQGINPKYGKDFSEDLVAGRDINEDKNELLVGEGYLKRLKIEDNNSVIGKKLIIKLDYPEVNGIKIKESKLIEGTIVGVLKKKTDYANNIVINAEKIDEIQEYYTGTKNYVADNGYDNVKAVCKDGYKISDISAKITKETGFMTFSLDMINATLNIASGILKSVLSIAGIIVLVVAGLGLVNTMTMTLQEKRKMIGVMRSVGASRGNIRLVFIFQSMMLGLSGGVLGAVLSTIVIYFVNEFVIKSDTFVISLTVFNVAISLVITLIISIIAGLIPSSKAAKLNVVEAVAEE